MEDCGRPKHHVLYGSVGKHGVSEMDNVETGQTQSSKNGTYTPRYAATEALRGDLGWSTFRERQNDESKFEVKSETGANGEYKTGTKTISWNNEIGKELCKID